MKRGIQNSVYAGLILISALLTAAEMNVRIHGCHQLPAAEIERLLTFKDRPGADTVIACTDSLLRACYRQEGFFALSVDSVKVTPGIEPSVQNMNVWITEGPAVLTENIKIEGDTLPDTAEEIMIELASMRGRRYREKAVERCLEALLKHASNQGYPLAVLNLEQVHIDENRLDLCYHYNRGSFMAVDTIYFSANLITKPKTLLRELRLESHAAFNEEQIENAGKNLQRLDYIKQVGAPVYVFGDGAVIRWAVEENNPNTIDGIVGYVPPQSDRPGAKGAFTGRMELVFRNLLGTGRKLDAFWQKKEDDSQSIRFGYEEPWIAGRPIFASVSFEQLIRDSTYLERDRKLTLRYMPRSVLSCDLNIGQTDIFPDSIGNVLLGLQESRRLYWGIGFQYQTLNHWYNPTAGLRYETRYFRGVKDSDASDDVSFRSLWIDVEWVHAFKPLHVFYIGFHGREVRMGSETVPMEDQIRIGGAKTLRGYLEDSFRGRRAAWINHEYRLISGKQSRAFVFFDAGWIESDSGRAKTRLSYGLGVRLETALGRIGVDYGLAHGESLSMGKIHVGIQNQF